MNTDPYARLQRDGKTVDAITDAALQKAERRLGYTLSITQGSYNAGKVAASAGTHDQGGVVDLMPWDWQNKVRALRAVGFAAWYRPAIPGLWPAHIHAVLIDHSHLAPSAARQVDDYLHHRNGLKDNGADTDPGWTATARFSWRDWLEDLDLKAELHDTIRKAKKADRRGMVKVLRRMRKRLPGG